jgi:elongation factor P
MEAESYEQFSLRAETLDDAIGFLKEGTTVDRTTYQGETLGIELPVTVDLLVAETEPGYAGDTAQGARKNATMETGLVVTVPLFVNEGDTLRIDTRTGEYQTRL